MRFRLLLLLLATFASGGCRHPAFVSDVTSTAKPWTGLAFLNDPAEFQFAIVSDRTGGHRDGIFESAIPKLNMLQPEFVLSVGDLIEGYTEDEVVLREQWNEFNGFVRRLNMPFFYAPGNHDNANGVMKRIYDELCGQSHYSFVYGDVLFLVLDSQDTPPAGIGPAQAGWATGVIDAHPNVRWTMVILHQPLWVMQEAADRKAAETGSEPKAFGFREIEAALDSRPYTVIAGHLHQYCLYERHDRRYITLATTGGASALGGPDEGQFDHVTWVTMTDEGPRIANLLLDGILPANIYAESHVRFRNNLAFAPPEAMDLSAGFELTLSLTSLFAEPLQASLEWTLPDRAPWTVTPTATNLVVAPGTASELTFALRFAGDDRLPPMPTCAGRFSAGDDFAPSGPLPVQMPIDMLLHDSRPTVRAAFAAAAPEIDGRLDDAVWQTPPLITDFRTADLGGPLAPTEAWVASDANSLYVALRCAEPRMDAIVTNVIEHDDNVWDDDSVEVFVGRTPEDGDYVQFVVSAGGTVYDAIGYDRGFNSAGLVAVRREADTWTVELSIPWSEVGDADTAVRSFELVRTRKAVREQSQFPPLNGSNHRRELHGWLRTGVESTDR